MLSLFDLILAETLDADLAAWLMAEVSQGRSFLIGARPGGAGKTTLMCALANLVPADTELVAATEEAVREGLGDGDGNGAPTPMLRDRAPERRCYLGHEIGQGSYYCYLWDGALRDYLSLSQRGHQLATNLHADNLDDAREQICEMNEAPEAHFRAFHILLFLHVRGGVLRPQRTVDQVYAGDGVGPHRLVYSRRDGTRDYERLCDGARLAQCRQFFADYLYSADRSLATVRRLFLDTAISRDPAPIGD